jgi:hypothetical protein
MFEKYTGTPVGAINFPRASERQTVSKTQIIYARAP